MPLQLQPDSLIVCDGDSFTNRRNPKSPDTWPFLRLMNWDKPWPDYFGEMLFCWYPELNLKVFNAAASGSTCRGMAERFEERVLARKPDWTVASVAGNDVRLGIPPGEYRKIMTTYAERLTSEVGGQVLFFGLSEHGPDFPDQKVQSMEGRRAMYVILADIADKTDGVHYVDLGPRMAAKARALKDQHELHTIYSDGGHLNAVGNLMLAGEMLRVFGFIGSET